MAIGPTICTLAEPLFVTVVPLVLTTVIVPCATASVTVTLLAPASASLMVMALPPVNGKSVSSLTLCEPGTELTGGSLTAVTLIVTVATFESEVPSFAL